MLSLINALKSAHIGTRAIFAGEKVIHNMASPKLKLFIFGWPSALGGADTKLAHLLILLHAHYDLTGIPNESRHLRNRLGTRFLDRLGVKYTLMDRLPRSSTAWRWRCPTSVSSLAGSLIAQRKRVSESSGPAK